MENSLKSAKEIKIPVPWGYIAAKAWGDDKDKIVLVFHGITDNAGSFDGLIPLLPNTFYYVCIDLPGHGRSSHFPPHLPIHTINYILVYKLIMAHFNNDRYTIIGHSYGGQIALLFTLLYPKFVDKLIMLDTVMPIPVPPEEAKLYLKDKFDGLLRMQQKLTSNKPPTYTYEEALEKIQFNRNYGIDLTAKGATALVERAIEPAENGRYRFTLDQRMKHWINPLFDFRYIVDMMKKCRVECPILIIFGSESSVQQFYMTPVVDVLKNRHKAIVKIVDGNHMVHTDFPENVAPLVSTFLINEKAKL